MQATANHSRRKRFEPEATIVPDAQWKSIVAYHTVALNSPPALEPAGATVDTATDAFWGSGNNELHLKRGPKDAPFSGDGSELYSLSNSLEKAKALFASLLAIPGAEVKNPFQGIRLLRINCWGKLKIKQIAYGSVYIAKNEKNLAASYVEGVIHNPNYPDKWGGGGRLGFDYDCSPAAKLVPLAAAVAGVGLLAGILFGLGRRGR